MYTKTKIAIYWLVLISGSALACEIPDDYNTYRNTAYKNANQNFVQCKTAMESYAYWSIVRSCMDDRQENKHERLYLCHEEASFRYLNESLEHIDSTCLVFKPTQNELISHLKDVLSSAGYEYCEQ
jgi:hypothetical protein